MRGPPSIAICRIQYTKQAFSPKVKDETSPRAVRPKSTTSSETARRLDTLKMLKRSGSEAKRHFDS